MHLFLLPHHQFIQKNCRSCPFNVTICTPRVEQPTLEPRQHSSCIRCIGILSAVGRDTNTDRDPYRERENPETMDPDCAICSSPALAQCDCEAKGLDTAVRQAETRMMTTFFADIRAWVRGHAQDYILTYFNVLTTRRRESHSMHIAHLSERALYYYGTRPHPTEIAAANAELKRGIDEDWRASVQRYPEVLEYFYSLVTFTLPRDDDSAVKDPPLSALTGARMRESGGGKGKRQERVEAGRSTPGLGSIRRPPPPPSSGYAYGGRY